MKDNDGKDVQAGDWITFSYGIPPVRAVCEVRDMDGTLFAIPVGHKPQRCKLRVLRRYVGEFYKCEKP